MIAVIVGPDYALARTELRKLTRSRDPDGNSSSTLDGKTASMNDVLMAATSIGFFSAGRLVIVEDLVARLGKQGAKESGSAPDWSALFKQIPEASTLILFDPSVQSVPAAIKKALPGDALVIVSDPPRGAQLIQWLRHAAREEGANLDERTARLIAETIYPQSWSAKSNNPAYDRPPDLDILHNEIAKLVTAALPGKITEAHVRALIDRGDDDQLFTFIDAAISGNLPAALVQLDRLLEAGEDPNKLLAQLGQQVELSVVMAAAGNRPPQEVGRDIALPNPNRMTSIQRGLRNQSGDVRRSVDSLKTIDRRMKVGELRNPIDALYEALMEIADARQQRR